MAFEGPCNISRDKGKIICQVPDNPNSTGKYFCFGQC